MKNKYSVGSIWIQGYNTVTIVSVKPYGKIDDKEALVYFKKSKTPNMLEYETMKEFEKKYTFINWG